MRERINRLLALMHMRIVISMTPMQHIRKSILCVSQSEMAAIASTTQATVSRWESGELVPDLAQMARIRDAAMSNGVDWSDAFFFTAPSTHPEEAGR